MSNNETQIMPAGQMKISLTNNLFHMFSFKKNKKKQLCKVYEANKHLTNIYSYFEFVVCFFCLFCFFLLDYLKEVGWPTLLRSKQSPQVYLSYEKQPPWGKQRRAGRDRILVGDWMRAIFKNLHRFEDIFIKHKSRRKKYISAAATLVKSWAYAHSLRRGTCT